MIFFGGTGQKTVECGAVTARCGRCAGGNLRLVHEYGYAHAFFIPVFKFGHHYFLVCGDCGAVFELPEEEGRALARDLDRPVDAGTMRPVGSAAGMTVETVAGAALPGARRFCTHCGAPLPAGAHYCAACGQKV